MESKEIIIESNGFKLAATLMTPDNIIHKLPAVIFYHGMISQRKPRYLKRAKKLARQGIVALCFDFRGCGQSQGKLGEITIADWFEDAKNAYDFLASQELVNPNRIGIAGKSFGGYMSALISWKRSVASMVLQAPAVYKDTWFDMKFTWNEEFTNERNTYRQTQESLENKAIEAIKHYKHPLLVIGSQRDDTVPGHIVEGYYDFCPSQNKQIHWIKDADHPLLKEKWNKEYTDLMIDWFKKTL